MKTWVTTIGLGVLVIAAVAYVLVGPAGRLKPAQGASTEGDYVLGLKRAPGTFQEATINISSTKDGLGPPDVTLDIDVMRPIFVPREIKVKRGQVVQLRLHGKDDGLADMPELQGAVGLKEFSGHGFQILGPYDVWVTGIRKGVTREVTFKATEAGEFALECVVFCHPSHYLMQGKLVVEEP